MRWGVRRTDAQLGYDTPAKEKKKSKHRLKLEARYVDKKGMSQEEAEKAAAKRIKIEKILAATAAITVIAASAYAARNTYLKRQANEILASVEKKDVLSLSNLPLIKGEHSMPSDLQNVNRNYKKGIPYRKNCTYATAAFEMRRRGFDVDAMPIATNGLSIDAWTSMFKNIDIKETYRANPADLLKEAASWGNGARGIAYTDFGRIGSKMGHAFSIEVQNGYAFFVDPQRNQISGPVDRYFSMANKGFLARVDNLEFSDLVLQAIKTKG